MQIPKLQNFSVRVERYLGSQLRFFALQTAASVLEGLQGLPGSTTVKSRSRADIQLKLFRLKFNTLMVLLLGVCCALNIYVLKICMLQS